MVTQVRTSSALLLHVAPRLTVLRSFFSRRKQLIKDFEDLKEVNQQLDNMCVCGEWPLIEASERGPD